MICVSCNLVFQHMDGRCPYCDAKLISESQDYQRLAQLLGRKPRQREHSPAYGTLSADNRVPLDRLRLRTKCKGSPRATTKQVQ